MTYRFMNEHTDISRVENNIDSPDEHADDACDLMEDLIQMVERHNPHANLTVENLGPIYNALQLIACPQYKVVLGEWNSRLDDEELEAFRIESNDDTMEYYLT